MSDSEKIPRLSRLTAILVKLQTRPYVDVHSLAEHFDVSKRTIYRDLASLEAAGMPLVAEEGKGYSLVEGFNIPPVMFTETEANALIIAEKFIAKTKDASLIAAFDSAIDKIKSVLHDSEKQKSDFLGRRTLIGKNWNHDRTSSYLSEIQTSLTNFNLLRMSYLKYEAEEPTSRVVEPFAIYHNTAENWILIAWCRLRNGFRNFRIDRVEELEILSEKFQPHKLSLEEYMEIQRQIWKQEAENSSSED